MTGLACPECGGRRPGCACTRAADLAAERAAAEDFDPLRIRPYVTLDAQDVEDPPTARLTAIRPDAGAYEAQTRVIPAYGPEPHGYGSEGGAHETVPLLLGGAGGADGGRPGARRDERSRKRRGTLVAGIAAAAVAGTAALAAAVLGGEETEDRAAVPEVTTSASLNIAVSEAPSPSSTSPAPTRTSSASPSPLASSDSPSPSASVSASASASSDPAPVSPSAPAGPTGTGSPSATGGTAPVASPSAAPATSAAPTTASPTTSDAPEGAILTLGDTGAEVRELQLRLTAVYAYWGDIDGVYSEEVRDAVASYQGMRWPRKDPEGVYGVHTRRNLEKQTPGIAG
ncbi:peptidoglycan-binding domain-containing protein [Streptomyces sp. CC208A]|uniref:peptidoglycan-binding domain-containing protein n=1 Tax=Streptomyces sp. CC208A TaxID=3044573 RepID=UPI0024A98F7F|nr:peptidoglycan-binding domain-containing protein [Streptomyces sp. CC208A]